MFIMRLTENKPRQTDRRTFGRVTRLPSPTDLVGVNFTDPHRFFVRLDIEARQPPVCRPESRSY